MASFGVRTQFATRAHVLRTPMPKRISVVTTLVKRQRRWDNVNSIPLYYGDEQS